MATNSLIQQFPVASRDANTSAFSGQRQGTAPPDATVTTCDDRSLPLQLQVHIPSPPAMNLSLPFGNCNLSSCKNFQKPVSWGIPDVHRDAEKLQNKYKVCHA